MSELSHQLGRRNKALVMFTLLFTTLIFSYADEQSFEVVSGASNCKYDANNAADWNEEINSFNLSGYDLVEDYQDDFYWGTEMGDNVYNTTNLKALRSDFHTAFAVKNDTASGLRLNLTTGQRYTFCFVTHSENSSEYLESPMVDFYLIKQYDWGFYREDYSSRFWDNRDFLNMIPPEWRDVGVWMPYRDVHSYEGKRTVDFAVSLDHDETSGAFFGLAESEYQSMYLVIDAWDNLRDTDTPAPHRNFTVDVTIMTEERLTLPNYTVSLVCCGLFSLLVASPVILHSRYHKAGIGISSAQGVDLMPMLETDATKGTPPAPPI